MSKKITKLSNSILEFKGTISSIMGKKDGSSRFQSLFRLYHELDSFELYLNPSRTKVIVTYPGYNNNIKNIYNLQNQKIILPIMQLYTNVSFLKLLAQQQVNFYSVNLIAESHKDFTKVVSEFCSQEFAEKAITSKKIQNVKHVLNNAIPELYHLSLSAPSRSYVFSEAEKLQEIRDVCTQVQIQHSSISFFDELSGCRKTTWINSHKAAYATLAALAKIRITILLWLEYNQPQNYNDLTPVKLLHNLEFEKLFL